MFGWLSQNDRINLSSIKLYLLFYYYIYHLINFDMIFIYNKIKFFLNDQKILYFFFLINDFLFIIIYYIYFFINKFIIYNK